MKSYDYLVVGAGPIGSYLAQKLADKGFNTLLVDKKKVIGKPVQCTGLITGELAKYVDVSNQDFIKNITNKINFYSKKESVAIKSKEYVVDRYEFDNYLLNSAKDSKAKVILGNEFLGVKNGNVALQKGFVKATTVIGCDGPNSTVNRCFNIIPVMNYFLGKQYVIKHSCDTSAYSVYLDEHFKDFL